MTPLLFVLVVAAPPDVVGLPPTDAQKQCDALIWEMQRKLADRPKEDGDKHFDAICREYLARFEEHLRKHPTDPSAVTALLEIAAYSRGLDRARRETALDRLRKEYLHTPLVVPSLRNLGLAMSKDERDLLHEIGDRNESRRIRALAWRALINGRESYISKWRAVRILPESVKADIAAWEKDIAFAREKLAAADLRGAIADLSPGSPAPALAAVDLDGRKIDLAGLKGKVVVVDFWHTRCGPCVRMIPRANALIREMKDRPFVHLGVSVDETQEQVREFHKKTEQLGVHGWVGWNSPALEVWNVEAYPTIFIIDHRGVIRHHQLGSADYAEVVRDLVTKAAADEKPADRPEPAEADPVRAALAREVVYPGLEDAQVRLGDVVAQFKQRFGLTITVDEKAFAAEGIPAGLNVKTMLDVDIAGSRPIEPEQMQLYHVLRRIVTRRVPSASGATFVVRDGRVEITTRAALRVAKRRPEPPPAATPALLQRLRTAEAFLKTPVNFPGFDDPKTTLDEALAHLGARHKVRFDIDERAFRDEQVMDVMKTEIAGRVPVAPLANAVGATVLDAVLARCVVPSRAVFVLRPTGEIEITTGAALKAEAGPRP